MNILIAIFLGGGTGAVSRYLITDLINRLLPSHIGYGTISSNLIGAFLMGLIFYFISSKILVNIVSLISVPILKVSSPATIFVCK